MYVCAPRRSAVDVIEAPKEVKLMESSISSGGCGLTPFFFKKKREERKKFGASELGVEGFVVKLV